jgi:hypothetical protein
MRHHEARVALTLWFRETVWEGMLMIGSTAVQIGMHRISDAQSLIDWYDGGNVIYGPSYYAYELQTPRDRVHLEDLALGVLLNGRPQARAALSLVRLTDDQRDISDVPETPLHLTAPDERTRILAAIMRLVGLSGIGSSLATKILHRKRPATIPILDNQAIYATLMSSDWRPGEHVRATTVASRERIEQALEKVYAVVSDPRNSDAFSLLEQQNPSLTRIEIFDKVWWAYIRKGAT